MTNVSKYPLTEKQERDLFTQLCVLFSNRPTETIQSIFYELFGEEEKVMIAKRLAIIVMLHRHQSLYFIAETLHVSSATVSRQQKLLLDGHYSELVNILSKPTPSIKLVLKAIDDILHLGGILPHYGETHRSEAFKKERELKRQRRI
jgi:uncharacterized protein YerC